MRLKDQEAFLAAAAKFVCYILVRPANRYSKDYIGEKAYTPKPMACKAKTSNVLDSTRSLKHAGLVVNPHTYPTAFKDASLRDALGLWDRTLAHDTAGEFEEDKDPRSPHLGCLKFKGKYIYSDYDLYDIIPVDAPSVNTAKLFGKVEWRGPMVDDVQTFVNEMIKVPMVQHGGEAQFKDHSEQTIEFFGPLGQRCTWLNELTARVRYFADFDNRPTLTDGKQNPIKQDARWEHVLPGFKLPKP